MTDIISSLPPEERYTPSYAEARLKEAADTLKRLPGGYPKTRMSRWPDVISSTFELRGWGNEKARRGPPLPAAIDRMDECIEWVMPMGSESRRLVWARACGIPWRRLEDMDGRSSVTLRKHYQYALEALCRRLNYPTA